MLFSRTLARWFPIPKLLMPPASGVDITDTSVKWLGFKEGSHGVRISSCGSLALPTGLVERGAIKDPLALAKILQEVKKQGGVRVAHAALPEEDAYIFGMRVPVRSTRAEIVTMIEFELEARVPIPPSQAVYDFDVVRLDEDHYEIAVSVFPRDLAEGYVQSFAQAGIELLSLEIEARSIGRAVAEAGRTALVVDCGFARTGIAILTNGIPVFTSTIDIGGAQFSKAVMDTLGLDEEQARVFKNEHGLLADDAGNKKALDALEVVAGHLADEIKKHYRFWDTRHPDHGPVQPIERMYLLGGSANLKGFGEYLAGKVRVETESPNVWRNAFSLDTYIPPIDRRTSLQYATAIGLALRSVS